MKIKGIKDGILISLQDQDWQDAKDSLIDNIKERQAFFEGAQVYLDVGTTILGTKAIDEIRKILLDQNIALAGVLGKSLVTQEAAQQLGLIAKLDRLPCTPTQKLKPLDTAVSGETAVLIQRTMRSGFKVSYQGHVVILGDVNPGAEVIATGSVIVWGRLRGTVHAGSEGDHSAIVCALDLSPTQLRIATKIATTPEDSAIPKPEVARILEDQIIAEPWQE